LWFAEHKNDPKIKALLQKEELWFEPIMNVDGYDFTFTCGTGATQHMCDYRTESPNNRFWRKTLRDNDNNGIYGNNQDGGDPKQRLLRNNPGRRRPEPQLPGQARNRRGGCLELVQLGDLPRPVRALGARE